MDTLRLPALPTLAFDSFLNSASPQLDAAHVWTSAWSLVLLGFASGALLGLGFAREQFLGGYQTWRRRLLRLGHIACIALGLLQMLYELSPAAHAAQGFVSATRAAWILGACAMPLVCWLAAWRKPLRHLFFVPVVALSTAVTLTLVAVHATNAGAA